MLLLCNIKITNFIKTIMKSSPKTIVMKSGSKRAILPPNCSFSNFLCSRIQNCVTYVFEVLKKDLKISVFQICGFNNT